MTVTDIIARATARNTTRFTFELLPPLKGEGAAGVFEAIETLVPFDPAYINVTFHREDATYKKRERPGTVGISAAIKRRFGITTVPHIICGGLSRYDIEDALIDLDLLEMRNVLALRGDRAKGEARFTPHPDGHTRAEELVAQIAAMNNGTLIDGPSACPTTFCVGVAGYPEGHSESPSPKADIENLRTKVDAGADYIVTQMCFDNRRILDFIDRCRAAGITVPIVPGIKPLATLSHLEILPRTFAVSLPDELVREAKKCPDNASVRRLGIEWAASQAAELKSAGLPIIHFYSMGRTDNIARIVERVF